MTENKFCLQWNEFETNMTVALKELREEKDFFDVTIACEDSQIQAHKVILSACSTFFRNLLRRNPHQHPLLYLKGVKYKELLSILNFMYNGEVNIAQEELKQFLSVAEDLKVKGLTQKMAIPTNPTMVTTPEAPKTFTNKRDSNEKGPAKKRLRPNLETSRQVLNPVITHQQMEDDEILEVVPVQKIIKESPKFKPKVYHSQSPQKIRQDMTPAPKILEQCILEAEINTEQKPKIPTEAVLEKTNTLMKVTPSKGNMVMGTTRQTNENSAFQKYPGLTVSKAKYELNTKDFILIEDLPENTNQQQNERNNGFSTQNENPELQGRKVETSTIMTTPRKSTNTVQHTKTPIKILPNTAIMSPKVTSGKMVFKQRKNSSPIKIFPKPPNLLYDVSTIEKFSTAWRCTICQKISSTKKVAREHLKVSHPKKNTN